MISYSLFVCLSSIGLLTIGINCQQLYAEAYDDIDDEPQSVSARANASRSKLCAMMSAMRSDSDVLCLPSSALLLPAAVHLQCGPLSQRGVLRRQQSERDLLHPVRMQEAGWRAQQSLCQRIRCLLHR